MSEARDTPAPVHAPGFPRLPGEAGVWVLIVGDMSVFGIFFAVFTYYRGLDLATFAASQAQLNQAYGLVNTLLLLASSWFVAIAVQTVREARPGDADIAPGCFAFAALCGLGFAGIKVIEYSEKIAAGITLTTNDFFMYYYMFTGIHFFHLLVGLVVLFFLWRRARAGVRTPSDLVFLESGASYWHMVDLLWIVLFTLLYLLR